MLQPHFLLYFICVGCLLICGVRANIAIQGRVSLPDGKPVHSTIVALNGGEYRASTSVDGHFQFHSIPAGIYVCDVQSSVYHFPQLKMKIDRDTHNISVVEYKYFGSKRLPATYPLSFVALSPVQYDVVKPPFSIVGLIMANPMMLLMLFSFVMVFAMPKMLSGMSPEELQEIQKQSAANGDPMKNFSKLMGIQSGNDEDDD